MSGGVTIRAFEPDDLDAIALQPGQQGDDFGFGRAGHLAMAENGPAFTALRDGHVIAIGGLTRNRADYATAWALIGEDAGPALTALTRAVRRVIAASSFRRIDMLVRSGFQPATRWAWMLGFAREGAMRGLGSDGTDFDLFALLKES